MIRGRRPFQRDSVVAELRRRIVRGELRPGSRLPSQRLLTEEFGTAIPTLHAAVQCLVRDGFIETQSTRGTFVSRMPPHLCAYGQVFPRLFVDTRFFRALQSAARSVFNSQSRRLQIYETNVNHPTDPANLRLLDDVTNERLAGVIMTWPTGNFNGSPLYAPDCPVPRVVLGGASVSPKVPTVQTNISAFYERALDRLIARGRRKIAHIGIGPEILDDPLEPIIHQRGLELRPYWHLWLGIMRFATAQAATHLLMSLPPADRPDGLIISDDNLVEHAQAGLVAAGIKVPTDLDVVAHCNWPEPPAAILPITYLGFDATGIMRVCTRLIDQQRAGEATAPSVSVDPVFVEELTRGVDAANPFEPSAC